MEGMLRDHVWLNEGVCGPGMWTIPIVVSVTKTAGPQVRGKLQGEPCILDSPTLEMGGGAHGTASS